MVKTYLYITILACSTDVLFPQELIKRITIDRHNVFDSTSSYVFEQMANSLHCLTKESIIRRELLFHIDDTVSASILYETERNLRNLGFIGDVKVQSSSNNDSSADVTVTTYDKWTLNFDSYLQREGGITSYGLSAGDDNFLGSGKSISLGYNYVSDRNDPNGYSGIYRDRRIFGYDLNTVLQYKYSEDLKIRTILLEKPFYTEATQTSFGMYAEKGVEKERYFNNGLLINESYLNFSSYKTWGIYSINDEHKYRFGAAFINQTEQVNEDFEYSFPVMSLVTVSAGILKRDFIPEHFINNLGVVEDIPFGYSSSLIAGKVLNQSKSYYVLQSNQISTFLSKAFFQACASIQGFVVNNFFSDESVIFQQYFFYQTSPQNTIASRLYYLKGIDWSTGHQIYLDSKNGLRGIEAFSLSGNSVVTWNIENRLSPDWNWWILKFGIVGFVDLGAISNAPTGLINAKLYKSIGFGIRVFNSKQQGSGLIRIDFAYNAEKKSSEIILSSDQLFSAFQEMDIASPLVGQ